MHWTINTTIASVNVTRDNWTKLIPSFPAAITKPPIRITEAQIAKTRPLSVQTNALGRGSLSHVAIPNTTVPTTAVETTQYSMVTVNEGGSSFQPATGAK